MYSCSGQQPVAFSLILVDVLFTKIVLNKTELHLVAHMDFYLYRKKANILGMLRLHSAGQMLAYFRKRLPWLSIDYRVVAWIRY